VITLVREIAALARRPDGILRPAEQNSDLGDVERSRPVLDSVKSQESQPVHFAPAVVPIRYSRERQNISPPRASHDWPAS